MKNNVAQRILDNTINFLIEEPGFFEWWGNLENIKKESLKNYIYYLIRKEISAELQKFLEIDWQDL